MQGQTYMNISTHANKIYGSKDLRGYKCQSKEIKKIMPYSEETIEIKQSQCHILY